MLEVIPEIVEILGRKKIRITLRNGEEVIDADLIDPFQSAQRLKVASRLAERAGETSLVARIEHAALQCIDLMSAQNAAQENKEAADVPIGPMRVVRPEMIIAPGVVAVSAAEVVIREGEAVGRWRIYLRIEEPVTGKDRRECRPLSSRIKVEAASQTPEELWVHPLPAPPSPALSGGWSDAGRKAWLEGAEADPVAVFDEICAALEEYLDVEEVVASGQLPVASKEAPVAKLATDNSQLATDSLATGNSQLATHPLIATLSLWIMLTYLYVAWDAVPYLFVNGPAGSGKTRVFELLSRLAFRPLSSSNLSAPALFRTLHDRGGTLLLDEAERLCDGGDDVAELRSILLAGYKRGGRASRLESSGDSYQMSEFQVFGPKAIACINALPPALASRCVPVQMFRSPPGSEQPKRRIDADPARWQKLRDDLHAVALGRLGQAALMLSSQSEVCPLGGRQYELWQPILALANWLDCERSKRNQASLFAPGADGLAMGSVHASVLQYAKRLCDTGSEALLPEEDFLLLWTLTEKTVRGEQPTCKMILEMARRADADAMRGISARKVAEILKRYGLVTVRSHGRSTFSNALENLKRVESRYGVDLNTVGRENVRLVQVRAY